MRDADKGVERCVLAGAISVAAALAVAFGGIEDCLNAELHPVEESDRRAGDYDRVLAVDHAVGHVA